MIEHRLIKRMITLIKNVSDQIEAIHEVDPVFIDTDVDFIRTDADRTYHGKEEDILFRSLDKRDLLGKDLQMMEELIEEHVFFGARRPRRLPKPIAVAARAIIQHYPKSQ